MSIGGKNPFEVSSSNSQDRVISDHRKGAFPDEKSDPGRRAVRIELTGEKFVNWGSAEEENHETEESRYADFSSAGMAPESDPGHDPDPCGRSHPRPLAAGRDQAPAEPDQRETPENEFREYPGRAGTGKEASRSQNEREAEGAKEAGVIGIAKGESVSRVETDPEAGETSQDDESHRGPGTGERVTGQKRSGKKQDGQRSEGGGSSQSDRRVVAPETAQRGESGEKQDATDPGDGDRVARSFRETDPEGQGEGGDPETEPLQFEVVASPLV